MAVPSGILTASARVGSGDAVATYDFLSTGWATFGLALPQGVATGGVKVGALATQTDVKTVWTDGSIRHCVVTANIDAAGTKVITPASASSGSLTPTWPTASVALTIGGTVCTATLPSLTTSNPWLTAGALAREYRVVVKPSSGGLDHAFLEVYFDVRSYLDGGHRVDISVENCLNVAAANSVTYDVAITVDGSVVFSQNAVLHYYMQRWRKYYLVGLTEATWTPDLTPFYASMTFPEFISDMTLPVRSAAFTICKWDPPYSVFSGMSGTGGRPELYTYPSWVCEYLVGKTQAQLVYMLRCADTASAGWSLHLHETTGRIIDNTVKTEFHLFYPGGTNGTTGPANGGGQHGCQPGEAQDVGPAHSYSPAYVPYMITGDRFLLDETKYWSNRDLISMAGVAANGWHLLSNQQTRSIGWGLRSFSECSTACPDDDPDKAYFAYWVTLNQTDLDAVVNTGGVWDLAHQPTGMCYKYGDTIAQWMQSYALYGMWRARRLGFTAQGAAAEIRLRDWMHTLMTSGTDFDWRVACSFYNMAPRHTSLAVFATMKEFYDYNYVDNGGERSPNPQLTVNTASNGYAGDSRFARLLAKAHGLAGATEALAFVDAFHGYNSNLPSTVLNDLRTGTSSAHQFYLAEFTDSGPEA